MKTGAEDISWPAPAKLNLFLNITGRRADGYHCLQTLYQILDWGDEVSIRVIEEPVIERLEEIPGVPFEEDLSIRAAILLRDHAGAQKGARIAIHKQIPQGSGLGGASSDAATVLVALNHLWACGLSGNELAALGLALGADVPVFVHGHSAWAEGIGEQLTPVSLGARHYVLVFPGVHISTAEIFSSSGLPREGKILDRRELVAGGDYSRVGNACQDVVQQLYPGMQKTLLELSEFGSPTMTGTGSAIFFPVSNKNDAERLTTELNCGYNVRAVRGVDRSPLMERLAASN